MGLQNDLSLLVHHDAATALGGGEIAILTELQILKELGYVARLSLLTSINANLSRDFFKEAQNYIDEIIVYEAGFFRNLLWRYLGIPIVEEFITRQIHNRARMLLDKVVSLFFRYDIIHVHFSLIEPLLPVYLDHNKPIMIKTVHDALYVCPLRSIPGTWLGYRCNGVWQQGARCYLDGVRFGPKNLLRTMRNLARLKELVNVLSQLYDVVIVPSKFLARMLEPIIVDVMVIRNSVPLELWRFRERKGYIKPGRRGRYVLFLSRLSPEKGIEKLKAVALRLKRYGIDLYIAGKGPLVGYVERLAAKLDNVKFIGFVWGLEKYQLILGARALLFPSTVAENMPISIAEALTLGTPVVSYDLGGQAELVRESGGGVLAKPFDIDEFADSVIQLIDDRENLEKSLAGYNWAFINLSPMVYAEKIIGLIKRLI